MKGFAARRGKVVVIYFWAAWCAALPATELVSILQPKFLRVVWSEDARGVRVPISTLTPPSCVYAPARAEEPERLAKFALSSETWAKSLQAPHEVDKSLRLSRTMTGGLENEAALYHPGNAVVKPLTFGRDPWEAHKLGRITQQAETM